MTSVEGEHRLRLPPGQVITAKWPVLTYGATPRPDMSKWTFRCRGLVENEIAWSWEEFLRLPRVEVVSDIHCVTRWSRFDNRWEGVAVREVLARARVLPAAVAVLVRTEEGYTTNLALEDISAENALLAIKHDGKDLEPDHGGPCRLVVPNLYFWKSAKWVREFEILDVNPPGFWEVNGYHMRADPWREERFSADETDAMQRLRSEAARELRARRDREKGS
ncbi:MAG TPA: sulfite oxidase-like oxidoreductase [Thermoanaerobaculia bacterium]|nr:sulfite oxidase-like oxidoreductase [Thermoanaerobaculia bacterium]